MVGRGRLIALEGVDGSGKTTQARLLGEALGALVTHEPGGTGLGRLLRDALLGSGPVVTTRAEALLMAADRAQHVDEVLEPALAAGRWVVTDRFSASTLAYQGYGRGLDLDELRRLVAWASGGLEPDLTVLVDTPVALARERRTAAPPDRLEQLDEGFHVRVGDGYRALAASDPGRWAVVDGSGPVAEVASGVLGAVTGRFGMAPAGGR